MQGYRYSSNHLQLARFASVPLSVNCEVHAVLIILTVIGIFKDGYLRCAWTQDYSWISGGEATIESFSRFQNVIIHDGDRNTQSCFTWPKGQGLNNW